MFYSAQTAIELLCQERWAGAAVEYPVLPGDPPLRAPMDFENTPLANADSFEYVLRPRVMFDESDNIGIGGICQRHRGRLDLCIFHRTGGGVSTALLLADDVCKYFKNSRFDIYNFGIGRVRKLPGESLGWVQAIASVPFEFDTRS